MKRFVSLLVMALLLIGAFPAAAAGSTTILATADTALPGEEITLAVDLSGNPGISAWVLMLEWDEEVLHLERDSVTLGAVFGGGIFAANDKNAGQLRMAWASIEDVTADGTMLTITFTVSESAEPDCYPIKVTASSVGNQNGEDISVTTVDAEVLVEAAQQNSSASEQEKPQQKPTEDTAAEQLSKDVFANPVFSDVPDTVYYYQPALWAAERGITAGAAPGLFSPDNACDRAQAVTFLWRAYGSPEPALHVNPFTDVSSDAYYFKAVLWAVEQGITTGTTETTFSPNATVTRAQIAAFLYRSVQAIGGGFQGAWMFRIPFTDLPEWAFEPIAWCYMKNITTGTSETTFSPDQPCTRGQIVTFLYRTFVEQEN